MPYQIISAEITQAQYDAMVAKLNELKALFTFLINLTPEESVRPQDGRQQAAARHQVALLRAELPGHRVAVAIEPPRGPGR